MNKIINKESISYLMFGILTTAVYFITRFTIIALTDNSMLAVVLAQVTAILFAYITNKIFVFKNKEWALKQVLKQLFGFIVGRLFVFGLDVGITFLTVEKFPDFFIHLLFLDKINYDFVLFSSSLTKHFIGSSKLLNEFIFAFFVQVLAIVINYIISKKAVFKKDA
ncbi:GtrA family protein [Vagococcus carniphilus]|uniref:GtrA family protein n=1 Tax=Vagococcus carniphilus TaxID=218144 RepID=UPI0028921B76|nr:GtrA family protein [Vagococcus carniphilus]MDT2815348.1 GtrA family protein [Vagococcus carniphilus]MDT2866392.1 GtrA family protein [Vagococcus carniphilus]